MGTGLSDEAVKFNPFTTEFKWT